MIQRVSTENATQLARCRKIAFSSVVTISIIPDFCRASTSRVLAGTLNRDESGARWVESNFRLLRIHSGRTQHEPARRQSPRSGHDRRYQPPLPELPSRLIFQTQGSARRPGPDLVPTRPAQPSRSVTDLVRTAAPSTGSSRGRRSAQDLRSAAPGTDQAGSRRGGSGMW